MADAEQYELMQIAFAAVGKDFTGKDDLIGAKYSKLQKLEMVPATTATPSYQQVFFFDQCCARHNNCGSHVPVLK